MTPPRHLYGLTAEFLSHEPLLEAARRTRDAGYRCIDAFAPYPVDGLPEAIGHKKNAVALICLIGGLVGGGGGYFMEDYAMSTAYPLNVGGRPLHSIPQFIPITFELTILCAALFTFFGLLALNGLPRLHHPIFNAPGFKRATIDRFFLCIEARDPKFDLAATRAFLRGLNSLEVSEVYDR